MELLLLLGVLGLLVWAIVYLRFSGILGCLIATLLAGTVVGHPFFHVSAITIDRLLLLATIGLFAVYQTRGWNQPRAFGLPDILFAFFVLALILTSVANPSPDFAGSISKLVFFYLLPAIMYALAGQVKLTPIQLRWMYLILAGFGLYLALTAIAEKVDWRWAVFPKYISDPDFAEFLGRGRGPLLNPAANGILLTLALSCGIMPLLWYRGIGRLGIAATIPIYLVGILCTMTRSVWLGCMAVLIGILVAIAPNRLRLPLAMVILGCGTVASLVDLDALLTFKRDRHVTVEQMRGSAELRPILAMVAWKMFQDRPFLGCGTGQYKTISKTYLSDRSTILQLEKARPYVQHNMFLAMLVENGLLTIIPFCLILLRWSLWAWQLWTSNQLALEYRQLGIVSLSLLLAYIINGMFHDVLIFPMINMYVFFIAGCTRNCAVHLETLGQGQPRGVEVSSDLWHPQLHTA